MQAANPWRGCALRVSLRRLSSQANPPTCAVPDASTSTTSVEPTAARGGWRDLEEQHPVGWRRRHRHLVRHVHLLSALGSIAAPAPCASLAALTTASAQPLSTRTPGACGDCLGVETKDGQDVRDSKRADETKSDKAGRQRQKEQGCPRHVRGTACCTIARNHCVLREARSRHPASSPQPSSAPRFLFFLLTSVFLGCASPPIASSALPPPSSQIYTTGGKYQSKSFVQWDGPPPRQGRRGRLLWLSDRAGRATTKTAKGAVCALWSGARSQCTCGLRDPEACAVASGRIQSGGPARGRGGAGAEPGQGRGGLGRSGAERAPGEMRALEETNTTHT